MQFRPIGGLDSLSFDALGGRPDLALRLQRDALGFQAAMIDARVDVEFGQPRIGEFGPMLAPGQQQAPVRSDRGVSRCAGSERPRPLPASVPIRHGRMPGIGGDPGASPHSACETPG